VVEVQNDERRGDDLPVTPGIQADVAHRFERRISVWVRTAVVSCSRPGRTGEVQIGHPSGTVTSMPSGYHAGRQPLARWDRRHRRGERARRHARSSQRHRRSVQNSCGPRRNLLASFGTVEAAWAALNNISHRRQHRPALSTSRGCASTRTGLGPLAAPGVRRAAFDVDALERALLTTVSGIAAGVRNNRLALARRSTSRQDGERRVYRQY
jgi:hypothetical protein